MPISGTTISIMGMLTNIKRDNNRRPTFEVELDNIAYLTRQSGASAGSSNRTASSISPSRNRFNYDSGLPVSNSLPSPVALGKRKEIEEENTEDSSEHHTKRSHTASDEAE